MSFNNNPNKRQNIWPQTTIANNDKLFIDNPKVLEHDRKQQIESFHPKLKP